MDQRRQMLSALVAVTLFVAWMNVAPLLFPGMFPKPKAPGNQNQAAAQNAAGKDEAAPPRAEAAVENNEQPAASPEKVPEFPARSVVLGEKGFQDGFLLKAELTTQGAGISSVWLTDPRYTTEDRKEQLKVVGSDVQRNIGKGPVPNTFDTPVPEIDSLLEAQGLSLATVNWEVAHQDPQGNSVTFRYPSPAGDLEVLKTYSIPKVDTKNRDRDVAGYLMDVTIELRNLTDRKQSARYSIQGPMGVPLEDADNTRVYREIKLGTLDNPRNPNSVTSTNVLAAALVKQYDKAQQQGARLKDWRAPVRFVGIDNQFFAALIVPKGNQLAGPDAEGNPSSLIAITEPELVFRAPKPERSALSVVLTSPELNIPAKGSVVNQYQTFFGPKRPELMRELNAESIIQLGWFAPVAKIMLLILGFFHSTVGLPYALSIIALTVVVRLAMVPISRKQAIEAEKMKILAPKMKEMQDKYKSQPEEFARAYREFQRKHNYHPMMGCLPALIQLPIFLGLYNSLFHAVDLRLAKFLWIDNLAAPDRLFALPFTVPYFGWTEFNLLPFITVALFVVQQKMFTPPPTSEEQAMQYKMMNFMMIFIGFAFYRVPAGLCLYFIASSLWGVCERLLLKKSLATHQQALAEAEAEDRENNGTNAVIVNRPKGTATAEPPAKAPSWWDKIREAADQAKNPTDAQSSQRKFTKDKGGKGSKYRK